MGYVILFLFLACVLYSPELFLTVFGLVAAGWVGYTMAKEKNEEKTLQKKVIEPLEIDPDELKTPSEKLYEPEVESSLKPEARIKYIIKREKQKLEKIVSNYMKKLERKEA